MPDLLVPSVDRSLGIDDEETEVVLDAISTESARRILASLDDGPATASELADRTDLTAQNVSYHLEKLTEADLVQTDGTRGAGGNAATVYAPARSVIVATETNVGRRLRTGVVGLVTGVLLSFACLHSVVESTVASLAVLEYGLVLFALL